MRLDIAALQVKIALGKARAAANGCSIREVRNAARHDFGRNPSAAATPSLIAGS